MDLTRLLRGKTVAAVLTNGHILAVRCSDGSEINIAWADDNGNAIKGRPVVHSRGARLMARGFTDQLIFHPKALL